ncbi:MAG: hypothetical protein QXT28_09105 [Thermofilaceae archaeon]
MTSSSSGLAKPRGKLPPITLSAREAYWGGAGAALYARVLQMVFERIAAHDYRTALELTEYLVDIFPEEEREKVEKALLAVDLERELELPDDLPPEKYRVLRARLYAKLRLRYLLRLSSRWINRAMFLRGAPELELR